MTICLIDLPAEILLKIFSSLSPNDLCSISLVNSLLKSFTEDENIWIARAKEDYKAYLKKDENFSPRQFYQQVLHKFGPLFGVWQRTDLRYYSGLIKVYLRDNSVVFDQLLAPNFIAAELRREAMFVIRAKTSDEVDEVEKGHLYKMLPGSVKIMFEDKTLLAEEIHSKENNGSIRRILYNFFTVQPETVGETDGILRILNDTQNEINLEKILEKYVAEEVGTNMNVDGVHFLQLFQLPIEKCRETLYANSSAWYKRVKMEFSGQNKNPLPEGLFKGDYGPHGVELIHLQVPEVGIKGLKGLKVTGDPNVPFDKITFEVDEDRCLNIPDEVQQSCNSIIQFHQNPQYVSYQEGLSLNFQLPDHCHGTENFPRSLTHCKGRWSCKCQIAGNGFNDPQMIPGNFIMFDDDLFAVLFLELNSLSMYIRVREL
eukprot:GFUD01001963.1.p1 GENE.GFUD01001963.1~~GFUD01001963.1.p1  ORF type:complete len:429 (+),score=77.61 GFUD01001963.1:49-1335(+)